MECLLPHEEYAAKIIAKEPRVLLFDHMGIGKTISLLEGLKQAYMDVTGAFKAIVCAPNTILDQWYGEILCWTEFQCVVVTGDSDNRGRKYAYFSATKENTLLLVNYNVLLKDQFFKNCSADVLVLDEGFLLRNNHTKTYKFIQEIQQRFNRMYVLSGNTETFSDKEFYNVVNLVFPGVYKKSKKVDLQRNLGELYISRGFECLDDDIKAKQEPDVEFISMELDVDQIGLLKSLAVEENRCSKNEDSYDAKLFRKKEYLISQSARTVDRDLRLSAKELFLISTVVKDPDKKFVIYCANKEFYKLLKADLQDAHVKTSFVSGDVPITVRNRNLRLFTSDDSVRCLLISGVGKFGLNLQVADTLICMTVPKSMFELNQMIGRLDRITQKNRVKCLILFMMETLEKQQVNKLSIK